MRNFLIVIIIILFGQVTEVFSRVFPQLDVTVNNNPYPGYIFIGPIATNYLGIYDTYGEVPYYKQMSEEGSRYINLEVQPNGVLSAFDMINKVWFLLDENLNVIDSVKAVPPYYADFHSFKILPNGNFLLIATDMRRIDMSRYFENGNKEALVTGFVIQEIDKNSRSAVFMWNTFDHFSILDAADSIDILQANPVPFHCNSVIKDSQGNYLASFRNMDEITKIRGSDGAIIWRMGGSKCKNNQFKFVNDTINGFFGFSHTHDISINSNGRLLVFDNGNLKPTEYSRVVEYSINESNKTVTKTWEYDAGREIYSGYMGSVQELPNGDMFIGWGGSDGGTHGKLLSEITRSGEVLFEMRGSQYGTYRALKHIFKMNAVVKAVNSSGTYDFNDSKYTTGVKLTLNSVSSSGHVYVQKHDYEPYNMSFSEDEEPCYVFPKRWVISRRGVNFSSGTVKFSVSNIGNVENPRYLKIYYRSTEHHGTFSLLTTTYNQTENVISANINAPGELIVAYSDVSIITLLKPYDLSINQEYTTTLQWTRNNPTEKYFLQVAKDGEFTEMVFDTMDLINNEYVLRNLQPNTRYYWRVRSQSSNCTSKWSKVFSFKTRIKSPTLYFPFNNRVNIPVEGELNWIATPEASNYNLQISKNPEFSMLVANVQGLTYAFYQYSNLENFTDYYWRVCAVNGEDISNWSDVWTFRTVMGKVQHFYPRNDTINQPTTLVLHWNKLKGADMYQLQVSLDSNFRNYVLNLTGIQDTFQAVNDLKNSNVYYWRVRAANKDGNNEWSKPWHFETMLSKVRLNSPKNNTENVSTSILLLWEALPQAQNYIINISTDINFENNTINLFSYSSYFQMKNLEYDKKYYWKVQAINGEKFGEWSDIYTFTTHKKGRLAMPQLYSPFNNQAKVSVNPTLSWNMTENAISYNVQLARDNNFTDLVAEASNITTTNFQVYGLTYNTKYFWRILAKNQSSDSEWSETWTFLTQLQKPLLISPLNNAIINSGIVQLEWEHVSGATNYRLNVSEDPDFNVLIVNSDEINFNKIDLNNLNQDIVYYWRVMALSDVNESDWSQVHSFKLKQINNVNDEIIFDQKSVIAVYPNPVNSYIIFELDHSADVSDKKGFNSVQIFDIIGNKVVDINLTSPLDELLINIENLPQGLYNYVTKLGKYIYNGRFVKVN
jgi:hypothetical protein